MLIAGKTESFMILCEIIALMKIPVVVGMLADINDLIFIKNLVVPLKHT